MAVCEICVQKSCVLVGDLTRSSFVRASKPFRARFKGLSSVLRSPSEQYPATAPSELV